MGQTGVQVSWLCALALTLRGGPGPGPLHPTPAVPGLTGILALPLPLQRTSPGWHRTLGPPLVLTQALPVTISLLLHSPRRASWEESKGQEERLQEERPRGSQGQQPGEEGESEGRR